MIKDESQLDWSGVMDHAGPADALQAVPALAAQHGQSIDNSLYLPQVRASLRQLRATRCAKERQQTVRIEDAQGSALVELRIVSLSAIESLQEDLAYLGYASRGYAADGAYVFRHCAAGCRHL